VKIVAYEKEKDVLVEELGPVENTELFGEVRTYDGGEQKLSVYRVVGKDKDKRRQVFRLSFAEVTELGEFLVQFTSTHGTGETVSDEDMEF
jgi:hypothetical protein